MNTAKEPLDGVNENPVVISRSSSSNTLLVFNYSCTNCNYCPSLVKEYIRCDLFGT